MKDLVIAKLDTARLALREAKTMQEAKRIADVAEAARIYAKRQELGEEAIGYALSIKIEALRRLGEMLQATERNRGALRRGPAIPERNDGAMPTLKELGLKPKTSMIAQKLAELPEKQFKQVREGTSTIAKAIREVVHARRPKVTPPTGKYRVIYADPPWHYGNSGIIGAGDNYGHAARHYPSTTIAELCALPIVDLGDENSVLFLWVTSPLLEECFEVIKAWNYKYKTSMIWDKDAHNFGHYVSVRHEFLLICTRGSCTPDVKELPPSIITIKRKGHSEKPKEFRAVIDKLYPNGKRIELFARSVADGWQTWGNEPN